MPKQEQEQNGVWKIILSCLGFATLIVSVVYAVGMEKDRIDSYVKKTDSLAVKVDSHEKDITEMKVDLKYIKAGIDEIKVEVKKK